MGSSENGFIPGQELGEYTDCQWVSWPAVTRHFANYRGPTQSAGHIKPLHWYTACRLVYEGGFHPDDIKPRPPFTVRRRGKEQLLIYDPSRGERSEATIFGGLKTKDVDVAVIQQGMGPVMAISHKGVTGAFRNLMNRMEETIGECTNLHMAYPALVMGYLVVLRGNRTATRNNDLAFSDGQVVDDIERFHTALGGLTGRLGIRDDASKYEAMAMVLVETEAPIAGAVVQTYPPAGSPIVLEFFFEKLYEQYDLRFVYGAPALASRTRRLEWAPDSPALLNPIPNLDYEPRLSADLP